MSSVVSRLLLDLFLFLIMENWASYVKWMGWVATISDRLASHMDRIEVFSNIRDCFPMIFH